MPQIDLKTEAIVLRRTNLGEADRLIDFLTPDGKFTALAKSVRKEKSRLAGGVEMFCLSQITLHQSQKTGHSTLTSAKMLKFYHNILRELPRLELASEIIRKIGHASDQTDSPEYFAVAKECFSALDDLNINYDIVAAWFYFNFAKTRGEQINLVTDANGEKLDPSLSYVWDSAEASLRPLPEGRIHAEEIKLMRLILSNRLQLVSKVQQIDNYLPEVLQVAKSVNQL